LKIEDLMNFIILIVDNPYEDSIYRLRYEQRRVNAPPAEREASGSPLEGGEHKYRVHLNPKSLAQNWTNKY